MALPQGQEKQWTLLEILQWTVEFFKEKEIDSPRLTAELLLAHLLGKERIYLYVSYDQPLEQRERELFKHLIRQRAQGVPTQYLIGKQEFWSLEFSVRPGVLIPRPETEHLVEAAIELASRFPAPRILDVGTGSGAIAVSLRHELPHATVHAGDISEEALLIARENAKKLLSGSNEVIFRHGDLFAPFAGGTFDLIVSNPPYISAPDYTSLAREVRDHEPKSALYAGEDGLDVYRRLIQDAPSFLSAEGFLLVEIGYGQHDAIVDIFQQRNFVVTNTINDYAGIQRVIVARLVDKDNSGDKDSTDNPQISGDIR